MLILGSLVLIAAIFFWLEKRHSIADSDYMNKSLSGIDPSMAGFRGWLLWFAMAFGLFTVLMFYNFLIKYLSLLSFIYEEHPDAFFAVTGWNIFILLVVFLSFYLMIRRSQYFPIAYFAIILLMAAWVPVEVSLRVCPKSSCWIA